MNFKKIFSLFLFLFFVTMSVIAQNFEWLKTYGTRITYESIVSVNASEDGGSVFLLDMAAQYIGSPSVPDTLHFDSIKFPTKIPLEKGDYLVRLDSNGKVLKAKSIGTFIINPYTTYNSVGTQICRDKDGNFYIIGILDGINKVGALSLNQANGRIVIVKFDENFNYVWAVQTGNSNSSASRSAFYYDGHIYFFGMSSGSTQLGTSNYNFGNNTCFYGELNPSDGKILWTNYLYNNTANREIEITGLVKLKQNIFLSGNAIKSVLIGSDSFYRGGFVAQLDTSGKYKKRFSFTSKKGIRLTCITDDGEFIYIGGAFSDSLQWGAKKIAPEYPTGGYYSDEEMFSASVNTALEPRWFFHPKILDKGKSNSIIAKVKCSEGYLYYSGMLGTKILIDSNILASSALGASDVIIYKTDFLGNILWATNGKSTYSFSYAMDALSGKSVFAAGLFSGKMTLGKHVDSALDKANSNYDSWLTKISDNSITRGKVKSGPYCAGDTIKIPYTKFGFFDSSNSFIAQLSDENGDFKSGHRELGRLKTNKDGTIMGVLPSFKVSTSANYRIRILSTKPAVQSYFLRDTLRLLIYSRDKADPGPAETICMGDSLKLNTYGGTKWTWSPKYNMADSNHRQTMAWPKTTTTYKIIIADSSGCGAPDTAFKKVIVRNPLKINLTFNDTAVCQKDKLIVPFQLMGGDSTNNTYQWFFVSSPKNWFPTKNGKSKSQDTLEHTPVSSLDKLAIILKDGCTSKADTAYLTISKRKPVTIKTNFRDTTLCTGNVLNYKATASGGIPEQYRYQWKDLATNSILSTTDSLKFLTKKSLKIQLIINDGCEALGDTALFEVKVKAELKAITNLRDTTICEGKSLNYTAQAVGGDSKTYTYSWVLNGTEISTSKILNLTSTLSLITTDKCSPSDTVKKTITIIPSPKADFTWDLACSRTVSKFKFTGTKPNSPITTTFYWNFNNEASSTLENPNHKFAKSGTSTSVLTLTSSNGCTDTLNKKIEIKVQAKAEFEVKDVCENQTALFTNQSQDATGYLWKFGDGQTSQQENPKHNYTISTTTTYNVTLVAQVTGGCADSISKALTINQNPSSDFSYTYNGSKVDLKIAKGGNSYQWKFGTTDSVKTTATTYNHTIKSSDQHTVCLTATDLSGCSSQTCKNVSVGILKLSEKSFKIFPNPNNGSFTIELDNPEMDAAIEVFDVMGKLVKKVERVEKVTLVDLEVASGIYVVKVKTGGAIWMRKILVSFGVATNR